MGDSSSNIQEELKECPYCAEMISAKAKKCKHCGEIIDPVLRELEMMKQHSQKNLIVNNNNNNNNSDPLVVVTGKANYPWFGHLIMTLLTGGLWIIPWALFYTFRDKSKYN